MRLVTNGNDPRIGFRNPTRLIFLFGYNINDVFFLQYILGHSGFVGGTNDVDLVVLPRMVATVDLNDIVSVSEQGVG